MRRHEAAPPPAYSGQTVKARAMSQSVRRLLFMRTVILLGTSQAATAGVARRWPAQQQSLARRAPVSTGRRRFSSRQSMKRAVPTHQRRSRRLLTGRCLSSCAYYSTTVRRKASETVSPGSVFALASPYDYWAADEVRTFAGEQGPARDR